MTPVLLAALWLPGLLLPFQLGRWCFRKGQTGTGLALFFLTLLALAALLLSVRQQWK